MTNFEKMKQQIQQMDIDEVAEWFSENCGCPDNECCGRLASEGGCAMCWKKWFEESVDD